MLANFNRFTSMYESLQQTNVKKGDYTVPYQSANPMMNYEVAHHPSLFKHTGMGRAMGVKLSSTLAKAGGATVYKNCNPVTVWMSETKSA